MNSENEEVSNFVNSNNIDLVSNSLMITEQLKIKYHSHTNQNFTQSEIKNLRKRKFLAENEIEKKMKLLEQLNDENTNLQLINTNLRNKLKDSKKDNISHDNITLKQNSIIENITTNKNNKINLEYFVDDSIANLKEELEDAELLYKTKKKLIKEVRKNTKSLSEKLETIINEYSSLSENKSICEKELKKLINEHDQLETNLNINKLNLKNHIDENLNLIENKNAKLNLIKNIDKIIVKKSSVENKIKTLNEKIKSTDFQLEKIYSTFNEISQEIENNQKNYASLVKENRTLNNKIQEFQLGIDNFQSFIKNTQLEIENVKLKLSKDKQEIESIENDMSNKLHFVRYSNSLVRSLFNIINTRRLQLEMFKILNRNEKKVYNVLFKKLDSIEENLIKEYNEYLEIFESS